MWKAMKAWFGRLVERLIQAAAHAVEDAIVTFVYRTVSARLA